MSSLTYTERNFPTITEVELPPLVTQGRETLCASRSARDRAAEPLSFEGAPTWARKTRDLFAPGDVLDNTYEIRRVLGRGGMGQVFEARDWHLNRMVAVKASWPHLPYDPLVREAQVLAAFHHPGLVTVHALGRHDGIAYLVMERLAGESLADRLRRESLTVDDAVRLLLQLCDPLGALHAGGLAHADLKPSNIMLVSPDRVVLLDLGIARIEQLRGDDHLISGSPQFMAPETIRGDVRPGQANLVDLYALGVIAFVLFTGRAPFDDPDPCELMVRRLSTDTPAARTLRPDLPERLDALTAGLLARRPEDRPSCVEEVRARLMQHARPRSCSGVDGRS